MFNAQGVPLGIGSRTRQNQTSVCCLRLRRAVTDGDLGPYDFAIILMMGASCAFINPAGFQTNLMVQGPGGYSFGDFAKVGLPLTVI